MPSSRSCRCAFGFDDHVLEALHHYGRLRPPSQRESADLLAADLDSQATVSGLGGAAPLAPEQVVAVHRQRPALPLDRGQFADTELPEQVRHEPSVRAAQRPNRRGTRSLPKPSQSTWV